MENYQSDSIVELSKAMIKVQKALQPATKDANNPFTKSHYATLNSIMDSCRDALLQNGIWMTQCPVPAESGHLGLMTKLIHAESGQWQSSLAIVPLPKPDPQGVGISMTYIRRYALSAMLGIVTEEDTDGEMGKRKQPSQKQNDYSENLNPNENMPGNSVNFEHLPKIDGISYHLFTDGEGRSCVFAGGDTMAKKELLKGSEFKWNPQRKIWWRYAEHV